MQTQVGEGKGLNKLSWSHDGKKIAMGGTDGKIYVYDIGEVKKERGRGRAKD